VPDSGPVVRRSGNDVDSADSLKCLECVSRSNSQFILYNPGTAQQQGSAKNERPEKSWKFLGSDRRHAEFTVDFVQTNISTQFLGAKFTEPLLRLQ
jgi:hypothetical protein